MLQTITVLSVVSCVVLVSADSIYCSSLTYKGAHSSFDGWCQSSCNQFSGSFPGYCPEEFCVCAGEGEVASSDYCETPRVCGSGEYVANPGTTASDAWCNSACGTDPANCPCSMCLCAVGDRCGVDQKELLLNFDEITNTTKMDYPLSSGYKGFNWSMYAYGMDVDKRGDISSGYTNGVVSPSGVLFSAYSKDIVISRSNFRILSGYFTAAWTNLELTVEGKKGGVSVFIERFGLDTNSPLFYEFTNLDLDELILSSKGTHNQHFVIDDLVFCVPLVGDLEKREFTNRNTRRDYNNSDPTRD